MMQYKMKLGATSPQGSPYGPSLFAGLAVSVVTRVFVSERGGILVVMPHGTCLKVKNLHLSVDSKKKDSDNS